MPRNVLAQRVALVDILRDLREKHPEAALDLAKQYIPEEEEDLAFSLNEAIYAAGLRQHLEEDEGGDELTGDHVRRMPNVLAAWIMAHPTRLRSLLEFSEKAKVRAEKAKRGPDLNDLLGADDERSDTEPGEERRQRRAPVQRQRRQRRPITDPEVLAKRKVALAKARAVRAERLAAAGAST